MSIPTKSLTSQISREAVLQALNVDLSGRACNPRIVTCPSRFEPALSVMPDHAC